MIGAGAVVATLSYVEGDRILQDIGMASVRLFGVAIAILVGINLIHREVDRRTVYTILSKPLSRGEFLLGKFLGLTLTIWLQMAIMGVAFAGVSLATGAPLGAPHLAFFLLTGVELALVVGDRDVLLVVHHAGPRRVLHDGHLGRGPSLAPAARSRRERGLRPVPLGRRGSCTACCPTSRASTCPPRPPTCSR